MLQSFNFSNTEEELALFQGSEDMKGFCREHGCGGIELQMIQDPLGSYLEEGLVQGVHLSFWNSWMDFWRGNMEGLLEEFGDLHTAEEYYRGTSRMSVVSALRRELDLAQALGAKYVVFHVSEVTIAESYHRNYRYRDEEVIDAACEWIYYLLDGQNYTFDFLMENLWWPGLNLTRPEMTKRLLNGVSYEKKGLMLDTGHLMNTNPDLRTQEEGVAYIQHILEEHREILPYIKGIHLNASLSGEYARRAAGKGTELSGNYWERWNNSYRHIFRVDQHKPFVCPWIRQVVEQIAPDYLTHELISITRKELGEMIDRQQKALEP